MVLYEKVFCYCCFFCCYLDIFFNSSLYQSKRVYESFELKCDLQKCFEKA